MRIFDYKIPSFVDYPGRIAAVLFTKGCNWNCSWCHNAKLKGKISKKGFSISYIISELKKYKGKISGVVITGGEPTLYGKRLVELLEKLKKETTFSLKLDTNGSNPLLLKEIIDKRLVNYIAMDIKATESNYSECVRAKINMEMIKNSVKLIKESKIEHRFRTTYGHKYTSEKDISLMEKQFNVKIYKQKYKPIEN